MGDAPVSTRQLTRRQVLVGLSAGGAVTFGPRWRLADALPRALPAGPRSALPDVTLRVLRRDDMLSLVVEGWNLHVVNGDTLERIVAGDAFVVVQLTGQHVLERAILLGDPVPTPGPSIDRLLAAPTRLAFKVPNGTTSIPLDVDTLLDWAAWQPSLAAAALPPNPGPPTIAAPAGTETAIVAPWQLVLSPDATGRWAHEHDPVGHAFGPVSWVELWHTMLGVDDGSGGVTVPPGAVPLVRAIWTPGYPIPPGDPFTPVSLTAAHRVALVRNTSSYFDDFGGPQTPIPARAQRLLLSPLGATLDVGGYWPNANLLAWTHRASLGRDTFVRVVEKGYLFPLGHPASLVTITERIFAANAGGDVVAYLRQRQFVVVRQPVIDHDQAPLANAPGNVQRQSPFRKVELQTLVTPDLDMTSNGQTDVSPALKHPDCFWLVAGGADVQFRVRATDWSGRPSDFDVPLVFVKAGAPTVDVYDPGQGGGGVAGMGAVRDAYVATANDPRRRRGFGNQAVAFATPGDAGDTDAAVENFTFDAAAWSGDATGDAGAFFAVLSADPDYGADVRLQAVRAVLGEDLPLRVVYSDAYLADGFSGTNAGLTYLEIPAAHVKKLQTPVKRSGGVATPTQDVEVISRGGPRGDRANAKAGHFDPASLFPDDAKLLGGLRLKDTLVNVSDPSKALDQMINVQTLPIVDPINPQQYIGVRTKFTFKPQLQPDPLGLLELVEENGQTKSKLTLESTLVTWYDQPDIVNQATVHGELESVKLHMFGKGPAEFFILGIDSLTFDISSEGAFSMDLDIDSVEFGDQLKFISEFAKAIPGGIPFKTELTEEGLDIHTDLPHLGIGIGVFSISSLRFDLGLLIPFDGSPGKFEFFFGRKDDPFIVAVSLLGGGGYVEIVLAANGVERLTIGFSFGAIAEINIGVASAALMVMVGIVFDLKVEYDQNKVPSQSVELVGFFRAVGVVVVLGLVGITIELYIGLAYKSVGKAYGRAKFTISVSVAMFSLSVGVDIERQLVGAAEDPTFADQFTAQDWTDYCAAFAA